MSLLGKLKYTMMLALNASCRVKMALMGTFNVHYTLYRKVDLNVQYKCTNMSALRKISIATIRNGVVYMLEDTVVSFISESR